MQKTIEKSEWVPKDKAAANESNGGHTQGLPLLESWKVGIRVQLINERPHKTW